MLLWDRIREYDMDHRKKKIGILTFQRAVNYGASLQMYALQKTVKELGELGIECEPIRVDDYTGKKMTFFHDPDGLPLELHE